MDYSLFPYVIDRQTGGVYYIDAAGNVFAWTNGGHGRGFGATSGGWALIGQIGAAALPLAAGYAQQARATGAAEKNIGAQFDSLDKQVAALARAAEQSPTPAAVSAFANAYSSLAQFAQKYAAVGYVAQQWAMEQPNYEKAIAFIQEKMASAVNSNQQTVNSQQQSAAAGGSQSAIGNQQSAITQQWWFLPALVGAGVYLATKN